MKYSKMREILDSKGVKERIMLFSLYGSQNYDADLIGADYDYHVYVFYGKDNLLDNVQKSKTYTLENGSVRVHDVRTLLKGFSNLNINNLEIFESDSLYVCPELKNLVAIIKRQNLVKRAIDTNREKFSDVTLGIMKSYKVRYEKDNKPKSLVRMTMFYAISYTLLSLASQEDVKFSDCLKVFDRTTCLNTIKSIENDSGFAKSLLEKNVLRMEQLKSLPVSTSTDSKKREDFDKNLKEVKVMLVRVLARL